MSAMAFPIIPVIMCGGAGTRLWPVSRESMPKQFVRLVGEASTFQQVLGRISDPELFARPLVLTHTDFRFVVAEQLRERGVEADIVLEPMSRDSGPAVAVSAVLAAERDRNALMLVLAADHVIRKPDEFRAACRLAAAVAAEGRIVTFGIEPTHPATSYGYIRPGGKLNGASARTVEAFVEKPDAATAATYMTQRYLWNSGNSYSTPRPCSARSSAASRRWPRPPRRRLPASPATSTSCGWRANPSPARRRNRSTTRSCSARSSRRWSLPIWVGRISAAGARSGTSSIMTPPAMPPTVPWSCSTAATAWCDPRNPSSPRWWGSTT